MKYFLTILFFACSNIDSYNLDETKALRIRYSNKDETKNEIIYATDSLFFDNEISLISKKRMTRIINLLKDEAYSKLAEHDNDWQNRPQFIQIELFNSNASISKLMNNKDSVKFAKWSKIINEIKQIAIDEK